MYISSSRVRGEVVAEEFGFYARTGIMNVPVALAVKVKEAQE